MHKISLLGATGSIGSNTLDIVALHPDRYQITAIAANRNVEKILAIYERFKPKVIAMADEEAAVSLQKQLPRCKVLMGEEGLKTVASLPEVDTVVAGIVGSAGLSSVLAAAHAGKRILLANKETLVMAGEIVMQAVMQSNATIIPIDSEHNALFQCMPPGYACGSPPSGVSRLILTASGGALRDYPLGELIHVTPEVASKHPNWEMGRKVTIDTATMMNKVLEVIEAHWLFGFEAHKIEAIIHPQSIIHSLVEYEDGSQLAQLGHPDMRTPIAVALAWPDRIATDVQKCNLTALKQLEFIAIDPERFPCFSLAYRALELGSLACTYLNAANEVAVDAFIAGKIKFTDIARVNQAVLTRFEPQSVVTLESIIHADTDARALANSICNLS